MSPKFQVPSLKSRARQGVPRPLELTGGIAGANAGLWILDFEP